MAERVSIRCTCGKVRGLAHDAELDSVSRAVCYCRWCKAQAHHLGRDDLLDEQGGTDVFQLSPARLEITEGLEHLAALRFTSKGPLRWYASCCNAPIANTFDTDRVPFLGLSTAIVDTERHDPDVVLGPVRAGIHGDFSGEQALALHHTRGKTLSMVVRLAALMGGWWLKGDAKRSPFFDASGAPIREPVRVKIEFP